MTDDVTLSPTEAMDLARTALMRVGMAEAAAAALARATLDAEMAGKRPVGFLHLTDYLRSLVDGRITARAEPLITSPVPAIMKCNAMGGVAQHGFSLAHEELAAKARTFGIAVFSLHNSYTTGELGWYAARLAEEGLVALAATNGPALMAGAGGRQPVYCTNPLAFAAPLEDGRLLLVDQASSMAAFVDIREAAARGETIPDGWALDQDGEPTIDPFAAMQGALLAYGSTRGANIALMVEVLAAGLTGANWSLDAPDFQAGEATPGIGLFVLALSPQLFADDFPARLARQVERLSGEFGVHIPGLRRTERQRQAESAGIVLPRQLFDSISSFRRN
ncbi:Ldh family oxidoreductase [Shinella zoogloeoides]|uniref:Ldh family oxidoreductase n=1 Tax=Shinella zoogloeoides TaxID=352475 RepID=UPI00299E0BD4|nr:Ldh family oxidoreductase [Shinella zoogloeoides]WPE20943.1 Delta(1)-pyrroline-2-carboxylate/Delta(1)-piperideine-2-carboxylate reductase [Shinella zoogloeoides]